MLILPDILVIVDMLICYLNIFEVRRHPTLVFLLFLSAVLVQTSVARDAMFVIAFIIAPLFVDTEAIQTVVATQKRANDR